MENTVDVEEITLKSPEINSHVWPKPAPPPESLSVPHVITPLASVSKTDVPEQPVRA